MARQASARVIEATEVLPLQLLVKLAVPGAVASAATPGQFVLLHAGRPGVYDPLLPRPYSIVGASQDRAAAGEGELDLLVFTGGRGAERLVSARPGEEFPLLGPLGNGYELGPRTRRALLLASGHGVAPMAGLARAALERGIAVTLAIGAPTSARLLPLSLLPDDAEIVIATEDGSRGHHGRVVDLAGEYLEWADRVFAYLPEEDYLALRGQVRDRAGGGKPAPVQAAMERTMACGVGVCLGCVVPTTGGLRTTCHDGPIFDLERLVLA